MIFTGIERGIAAFERAIATIVMAAIVVLVFVAAASRYLGAPINWSVDLAQALFVWVVYLGASMAMREGRHIGVSLVTDLLQPLPRRICAIAANLVIMAFLAAIVRLGIQVSIVNVNRELTSIPISYSFVTIAISVGSALMFVTLALRTWRIAAGRPVEDAPEGDVL